MIGYILGVYGWLTKLWYILGLYGGCKGIMEKLKLQLCRGCRGYIKWGGCQNHGPCLDPYYITAPNI